jgi:hypothetical protein
VLAVSQLGLCSTYRGAGRLARCLRGRPGEDLAAPGTMPVLPIYAAYILDHSDAVSRRGLLNTARQMSADDVVALPQRARE